jgi:Tol biopolymer transport system component
MVWSPDGSRVIYEHLSLNDSTSGLPTLWWINISTMENQSVFQESQVPGGNPRWSPNGEWLSYSSPEGIRLYHLEDGESRVIENILGAAAMWSPDGKSILLRDVVIKNEQFVTQLFLYDLASESLVNLNSNDGVENILAAWSPTGEFIAVVRRDLSIPRGYQIWLMRANGSDARAITNTPDVLHTSLNWSPDGNYLLYDLYQLDMFPFESRLQVIQVKSGEVTDLEIKGFTPQWVWK